MMSRPIGALFGVLTLVAILAIAPSAFADSPTVNISAGAGSGPTCSQSNNCFDPSTITVAPGTTVEWKNNDKVSHTVTSGNPSDNQTGTIFDSSLIASGKEFSFTFNNPGTYNYFCQVHPWMAGEVIVSASASSGAGSAGTTAAGNATSGSMSAGMNMSSSSGNAGMSNSSSSTNATTPMSGQVQQANNTQANNTPQNTTQTEQTTQPTQTENTQSSQPTQQSQPEQTSSQSSSTSTGSGGIEEPSSAGSDPVPAYTAGISIMAIMSGIGIWTAVRRR